MSRKPRTLIPQWKSGYTVTYHTGGSMTFRRFTRKIEATDSAYMHVHRGGGSAVSEVVPNACDTMRWGKLPCVTGLRFVWPVRGKIRCTAFLPNGKEVFG